MKAIILLTTICFVLLPSSATSQTVIHAKTPQDAEIGNIVQKIVNVIGVENRFEIRTAEGIENVAAVLIGKKYFIFYDEEFVESIRNSTGTDWARISIWCMK
ncbi:MAG TPA: hypothetical protein VEC36_07810 [Patescibacteria group bacterium]|nr:hypothetical protein [Patescibacteria group bacterium]